MFDVLRRGVDGDVAVEGVVGRVVLVKGQILRRRPTAVGERAALDVEEVLRNWNVRHLGDERSKLDGVVKRGRVVGRELGSVLPWRPDGGLRRAIDPGGASQAWLNHEGAMENSNLELIEGGGEG